MIENILQIIVGQVPEAIYFSLFIILTRGFKENRLKFTLAIVLEYLLLMNSLPYSVWSHLLFFILTYLIIRLVYKEKAQVTDIFTIAIASLAMIIVNAILYYIGMVTYNYYPIYVVLTRISMFLGLFLVRNKLPKLQKLYNKYWNRNDKIPKRMKSVTFRALNTVVFNLMFYIINIGMIFALFILRR